MNSKRMLSMIGWLLACACSMLPAFAQSADSVRWVSEKEEDATLWSRIRSDFREELQPDDPAKVRPVVAYSYKYIYRLAVYRDSALVIVGHRETKDSKYPGYYSAFNYDLQSHARTLVKGVEVVSLFKFVRFASLDTAVPQEIVFTWMTCTECEASQVLSSLHYDASTRQWMLRSWETNNEIWWTNSNGPTIWTDTAASDVLSFDCLHGFVTSDGKEVLGIRCREVDQPDDGKRKVTDITIRYTFKEAVSKLEILRVGEERTKLLAALCDQSPKNTLCTNHAARPAQK